MAEKNLHQLCIDIFQELRFVLMYRSLIRGIVDLNRELSYCHDVTCDAIEVKAIELQVLLVVWAKLQCQRHFRVSIALGTTSSSSCPPHRVNRTLN